MEMRTLAFFLMIITSFGIPVYSNDIANTTTVGLLEELKSLEENFMASNKTEDLMLMYNDLGKRIQAYSGHRLKSESGKDYGTALYYALRAAHTQSQYLEDGTNYVILIRKYADLTSSKVMHILKSVNADFQSFRSNDQALEKLVHETGMIICSNLVLIEYQRLFNPYKQFVFPYAREYLSGILNVFVLPKPLNSSLFIREISENIEKIRDKLDEINLTGFGGIYSNYKRQANFDRDSDHLGPFQIWKNETYYEMISDLLDGKEVTLIPDARKIAAYAVKFKEIKIGLIARDGNQKRLNKRLRRLEMSMSHEGDSNYICGDKMYLISHSPVRFRRSFHKNGSKSDSVTKFLTGDDSASPFATWRVKIHDNEGGIELNSLASFKKNVDLVFEGYGTYLQVTDNVICNNNTNLSDYYEEYAPIGV